MKICYGCFSQLTDSLGNCPYCGFDERTYSSPDWILPPGTVLKNKYFLGKRLGEGGFGITYLAFDMQTRERLAIKEYYPGSFVSRSVVTGKYSVIPTRADFDYEKGVEKFAMEANVLARFSGLEGIVKVKDFFRDNNTSYIVMEFIDGLSIKQYLKANGGLLNYETALRLIRPVITSLAVIHKNNVLHRDISPDNIMIEKSGKVRLIDFGTARSFEIGDEQKSMTIMLRHGYAPIEQYSSSGQGPYTDVYALCAVLYRMITGVSPTKSTDRWNEDNLIPILQINKTVPKHIADVIEHGLNVRSRDRYQSMEELERELFSTALERAAENADNAMTQVLKGLGIFAILMVMGTVAFLGYRHLKRTSSSGPEIVQESKSTSKKRSSKSKSESESKSGRNDFFGSANETKAESSKTKAREVSDEDMARAEDAVNTVYYGYITGHSSMTTGSILESYTDTGVKGKWSALPEDNGETTVFYNGYHNGEEYSIEFTVGDNYTYRVTGATRNGSRVDNYSGFFTEILEAIE